MSKSKKQIFNEAVANLDILSRTVMQRRQDLDDKVQDLRRQGYTDNDIIDYYTYVYAQAIYTRAFQKSELNKERRILDLKQKKLK